MTAPHADQTVPAWDSLLPLSRPARRPCAPCDRLEGVAFEILQDAAENDFRRHLKYSPMAVIEKVVSRRESVASCGSTPSYLWARLELDEDGEPEPVIDLGHMPYSVLCAPPIYKYGPHKGTPDRSRRSWRVSLPGHEASESGPWTLLIGDSHIRPQDARDFPLLRAIPIGTRFLIRVAIIYSTSFEGEVDCSIEPSILYIDPAPAVTFLPIALDDETATAIGSRPARPALWRIAE